MSSTFYPILEREIPEFDVSAVSGKALVQAVYDWSVPALNRLHDFFSLNAGAIAAIFGDNEKGALPVERWFPASDGLQAVRQALTTLLGDVPKDFPVEAVIADLVSVEAALLLAQKHNVRFHFTIGLRERTH